MPRGFSEIESHIIRKKLIQLGIDLFSKRGLKKTTVEELALGAGIAKGSFYKFYPTKEALCFACLESQEKEFRENKLTPLFESPKSRREKIHDLVTAIFTMTSTYPLIGMILDPKEYEALLRGLPEEVLHHHKKNDEDLMSIMITELFEGNPDFKRKEITPQGLNGLFWLLALLNIHKPELGEAFGPATELMANVIASGIESVLSQEEHS